MTKLMQLDPTTYKNGLYTLVSDPSLVGNQRRSKRLSIDDIPSKPRIWDITPIIHPPTLPDLELVDTFQMTVGVQQQLQIDSSSAFINVGGQPIYKHGCVKTNINLGMLNDGDSWHVGFRNTDGPGGYSISNLIFGPNTQSASDLASAYVSSLINGSPPQANMLVLGSNRTGNNLSVSGSFYNPTLSAYQTSGGAFPVKYSAATESANNTTLLLLLSRNGVSLNVGIAALDTAGNYDIHEIHTLGDSNHPFDFASMTMFIYAGAIANPLIQYQTISPTLTTGLPAYNVGFTKYETSYGGSQAAFDALYPVAPHRPSGTLVEHAVFPEGTRVGELLNVYVDLQYVGPPPRPYGFTTLQSGQTIMVTSISSEGKDYNRMIRSNEFDPLVQTVNGLTTGSTAGLPYGEIVVYVNNSLDTFDLFTGDRAFDTFDMAYEYLITLPPYLPKRMVLDDRPIDATGPNYFEGVVGKTYLFGANNIKLSTFSAFSGEPYPRYYNGNNEHRPDPQTNPWLYLRDIIFDSIHLVDFWGTFIQNQNADAHVWLGDSAVTQTSPNSLRAANLRLGKNTALYATEGTIDYYDGGSILLEDDAFLMLHFSLYKFDEPLNTHFEVHKSAKARLYVTASGTNYQTSLPYSGVPYQMSVYYPLGGLLVEFPPNDGSIPAIVNLVEINYNYAPAFVVDNVVMVRSLTDFKPDYDYSGNIVLPDTATTFFIVGTVNLGSHSLYGGSGDVKHHFMGFPDSCLIGDSHILASNTVNGNQSFKFTGIELKTTSVAPQQAVIHMESGGLEIDNCKIDSPAGIRYIANAIPSAATAWPISIKSTEFTSQVRSPGSMIRINSYCNVLLRDVIHSGDVFPQQPLMDLRGQSQTAHLIIDGFTVVGNDEPFTSPLFVIDSLPKSNGYISVRGVHMTHGNVNDNRSVFFGLFTLDYLGTNMGYYTPYDNAQDNRIVTDRSRGFMLFKAPGVLTAIANTATDYIVNLNETQVASANVKKYGFLNAVEGAQTYLLNEHKLYEIRVKSTIAAGANLTLEVKIKRTDNPFDEEHESDFVTVVTDGSGEALLDATYYRTMVGGATYALTVRNVSQPINIALTDLVLSIREF